MSRLCRWARVTDPRHSINFMKSSRPIYPVRTLVSVSHRFRAEETHEQLFLRHFRLKIPRLASLFNATCCAIFRTRAVFPIEGLAARITRSGAEVGRHSIQIDVARGDAGDHLPIVVGLFEQSRGGPSISPNRDKTKALCASRKDRTAISRLDPEFLQAGEA